MNQNTITQSQTFKAPHQFLSWVEATYGEDADKIDVEAHYDDALTDSENRAHFRETFSITDRTWRDMAQKPTEDDYIQLEATHAETYAPNRSDAPFKDLLENIGSIAIVGDRGSGKTVLAHRVCDTLKEQKLPVYVFKHPRPQDMYALGYKVLFRFGDLEDLQDCVLWISEPQLHIPSYDKKANDGLMRLLSLCRQRNVKLVIDTCDTRFITRGIESYIDAWMVKDCDPQLIKQGSKVKNIIKGSCLISVDGFGLPKEQFLYDARKHPELSGRHRFVLPSYWTEKLSVPYRISA